MAAWAQKNCQAERLQAARPEIPNELDDRQADICEPLLAIADHAGGSWSQRCREALVGLYAIDDEDEESLRVKLLADIRKAFESAKADRLGTEQLLGLLVAQEGDAPWADW